MAGSGEWSPMRELVTVQKRMNQLFESALTRTEFPTEHGVDSWSPVADVVETDDTWVVCLELPGSELSGIELHLDGDELLVEGDRSMEHEGDGERFHRVERSYGKFSRRLPLPASVDRDAVEATYRDGVLTVVLRRQGQRSGRPVRLPIR